MQAERKQTVNQPVVAVVGHIDHGKSTLLDFIRKTNITEKEAGGITQRLGAYEVVHTGKDGVPHPITFLDTPGHEAFKGIRERGASVADVAILVVSAEDGAKPQTIEAFQFIKKTETPCVIAFTKIDKPTASAERAKQSLAEHEIYVEGYGGEIPTIGVSGKTGAGVDELLDIILLLVEMHPRKDSLDAAPTGFVIEAEVSKTKGVFATLISTDGVLTKGMYAVAEGAMTPIRRLESTRGESLNETHPGMPILVAGWDTLPRIGARFTATADRKSAERMVEEYRSRVKSPTKNVAVAVMSEQVLIPILLKADTSGSLEALQHEIRKLETEKVAFQVISGGVGRIGEADLKTAQGCREPVMIGLAVAIDDGARSLIERGGITIIVGEVIYTLMEELQKLVTARTPKTKEVVVTGSAKILKLFNKEKDKQIVGGKVMVGELRVGDELAIFRRDAEIGKGKVRELQRQKEKVSVVPKDSEFGAAIVASVELAPQDRIEASTVRET